MINKKIVAISAILTLILVLGLNRITQLHGRGQLESGFIASAAEVIGSALIPPIVIYNHFTQANEGPIDRAQKVLLLVCCLSWGLLVERLINRRKRRRSAH